MNQILFFCEQCGFRVPPQDMESGAAKALEDNRAICCRCLPAGQRRTSAHGVARPRESMTGIRPAAPQTAGAAAPAAASRSTGKLPRLTPGPATSAAAEPAPASRSTSQLPTATPVSRSTSHSHAVHPHASESRVAPSSNAYLYIGGAVLVLAMVVGVIVAVSSRPAKPEVRPQGTTSTVMTTTGQPDVPANATSNTTSTTTTTVSTTGTSDDPADRALEKAYAFARENPKDVDGYFYELLRVMRMYKDSRAAAKALEMQRSLLFPIGDTPPPLPDWYDEWAFSPNKDKILPRFSHEGRYAVLETRPANSSTARFLKRRIKAEGNLPILEFDVRGDAGQRCEIGVKLGNRDVLNLPVEGAEWRRVSLDCSARKGEEFEVVLAHRPGSSGNEAVYWTPPRWRGQVTAGASAVVLPGIVRRTAPPLPADTAWSKAVDLLPLVKPAEDGVEGTWRMDGGAVVSPSVKFGRLALPYRPPEEYDLKVTFTRQSGSNSVTLLLARGGTCFGIQFAAWANKVCGLERVDGASANANVTTVENAIDNGRSYTAVVQVRGEGVWVYLDGQLLTQLATDYADLSPDPQWSMGAKQGQLGLAVYESEVAFRSAQVLEVTGKGYALRDGAGTSITAAEVPQVVDLLSQVNLAEDKIDGEWEQKGGELSIVPPSKTRSRLVLPYVPPEAYDFVVSLTIPGKPGDKKGQFCQAFSQGAKTLAFMAITDDPSRIRCGYEMFDGKSVSEGPTLVSGKPVLQLGQRHTFVTQVRKSGVRTFFDGEPLVAYPTDFSAASMHERWSLGEKGMGRLGLGVMNAHYVFHEAKVIEISGRGRIERVKGTSVVQKTPDAGPVTTTTTVPVAVAGDKARQAWAVFLDELTRHLQRDDTVAARKCADGVLADKNLATLKAEVEKDAKLVQYAADVEQAILDGFALLKDNRAFTFERKGEKPLKVGEGNRSRILKVAGETCEVEQDVGSGKVVVSIGLKELLRPSRLALAQQILTDKPADQIKLLVTEVARYVPGDGTELSILNRRLDTVAMDETQAPLVQRLREWMKQKDRESDFEVAYAKVITIVGKNEYEPAKTAAAELRKSFFDTAVFAASGPRMAELDKNVKALDLKPGAWAMYYNKKGNEHMGDLRVAEELKDLDEDYKENSPRNGVNRDNFGVRVRGVLLIEKNGKYEFQVRGDDNVSFWVDGKKVCEDNNKGDAAGSVDLEAGRHQLGVHFRENGGAAHWRVKWKKPGDTDFAPVPPSALRYDPLKKADYEKK